MCDKLTSFNPATGRTLDVMSLKIGTGGTVDGIKWKWSDGTVTYSPKTYLSSTDEINVAIDRNSKLMGFASQEGISSGNYQIYGLSLLEIDTTCLDK